MLVNELNDGMGWHPQGDGPVWFYGPERRERPDQG